MMLRSAEPTFRKFRGMAAKFTRLPARPRSRGCHFVLD